MSTMLRDIEYRALPARKLSQETCQLFGYGVSEFRGRPVQVAQTHDPSTRELVAQKLRFASKSDGMPVLGDASRLGRMLTFAHLWPAGCCRRLIITEGEIDAMSVSQVQGNKYAVVSLPLGAAGAKRSIAANLDYCEAFDEVVLMFDEDDAGREAVAECAPLFSPGKCKVARLPLKDASEMLVAGRAEDLVNCIWRAAPYRPDGMFTLSDIRDDILADVSVGAGWFIDEMTEWTFGRRAGETYYFGAGTGIGKTDFFTQQIAHDIAVLGIPCLVVYLEQPPAETGKRIVGKVAGKAFHVPGAGWTQEELDEALGKVEALGNLHLGGNFSVADWDTIKARIRHAAHECGVRHVYLDHLTALADTSNERESLERITKEIALMAQELGLVFHVISHLATPDGTPHEEGGRVMLRHFKGSRAIGFWAHYAFGLERNPQHTDPAERTVTTLRCLKDRYTGRANGKTLRLGFDAETGRLFHIAEENPFDCDEDDAMETSF